MSMTFKPDDVIHTKEKKAFRVISPLGQGGMSEVYRATDHSMSRTVVFKMLAPRALKHANRFIQEAKMLANVSHPNVARVFERGETVDGFPHYTMEDLDAWSLREILVTRAKDKKYGVTWEVALNITSQLLYGLAALHEAGIVHRDVKPENVLLAKQRNGQQVIKIIDPGIAKLLDDDRLEGLVATPMYAAPEQLIEATATPTPGSDLFATGLVLYELLTGRYAYSVYGVDLEGALERRDKPVPSASMLRRDLPPAVDSLLALMTDLDPNKRPTAIAAMHMAERIGLAQDAAGQMRSPRDVPVITESGLRQQPRREARITRADLDAPTDPDGHEVSPNLRYMQMLAEQARALGYDEVAYVREHTKGISAEELDQRYLMGVQETSPDVHVAGSAGGAVGHRPNPNGAPQPSVVLAPGYVVEATSHGQANANANEVDRTSPTRSAKFEVGPRDTPMMSPDSHGRAGGSPFVLPAPTKGGTVPMRPGFRAEDFAAPAVDVERVSRANEAPAKSAGTVPMRVAFSSEPSGVVMGPVETKPSQVPRGVVARRPPPVTEDSVVLEVYQPLSEDLPSRRAITPAAGRVVDHGAPRAHAKANAKVRIAGAPVSARPRKGSERELWEPVAKPIWPKVLVIVLVALLLGFGLSVLIFRRPS